MESKHKPKILVMIDWYLPGFGAGGPIQSVRNLCEALKEDFEFAIVTTNRDHHASRPYPDVQPNQWVQRPEGTRVYYFSEDELKQRSLHRLIASENPDFIYVNSLFSVPFTFWPLRYIASHKGKTRLLLAPRGMLHGGALRQKGLKKKIFLSLMRVTGIQNKITWQATDHQEIEDIKKHFGEKVHIHLAQNFPKQFQLPWKPLSKAVGEARLVYHSRLTPKKNLHFLLELMAGKKGLTLDVYGPQEDPDYLKQCQELVEKHGLRVSFRGGLHPDMLEELVPGYHFSVLPTLGENFGHSIFEALLGGSPVLVSDQTPWRKLAEKKIGWDLDLSKRKSWLDTLDTMLDMTEAAYNQWSKSAWDYALAYKSNPLAKKQMEDIFTEQSLK